MDITNYVVLILGILCTIICVFLIPYIKNKTDATKLTKIEQNAQSVLSVAKTVKYYADQYITAAAQKYDENATKKEYVTTMLTNKLAELGVTLDTDQIDATIESCYKDLKDTWNFNSTI